MDAMITHWVGHVRFFFLYQTEPLISFIKQYSQLWHLDNSDNKQEKYCFTNTEQIKGCCSRKVINQDPLCLSGYAA